MSNRNLGLGASDAAAAVGLSKWKSPYQLWQEKLGQAANDDDADGEALHLEMGKVLEPVAIARFERKAKLTVTDRQLQVVDPTWGVRWVTLDGRASDGGIVEAKSVGFADPREWGDEFEDSAVPMQYLIQAQHAMACTGATHAWVPVIVLNRQFRIYRVMRDEELIGMLTAKEREFWQHVIDRTPPPPIDAEDAYRQWPQDSGTTIECDELTLVAVAQYAQAKANIKAAEMDADLAKAKIATFMGPNAILVGPDRKPVITWKTAKGSVKVNVDAMRGAHPAIVKQFEFEQPGSRRMLIK
jgi:putative phage-type endonuclease